VSERATVPPALSWLYVPGDRPERFAKAAASGTHVVIVDLEDAVAPGNKARARREALAWLADAEPGRVEVRVNAAGTPEGRDDLVALASLASRGEPPALRAVRLPKVESAADVQRALGLLAPATVPVVCLLESALGVEDAYWIATASPRVAAIGLGEADLAADLRVSGEDGLAWPRSRVVVAARAAGLPAPAQSVYPRVDDPEGLAASCRRGRAMGFRGRAAIHPRQVPVIHDAYRPAEAEIADARAVLAALDAASGVAVLPDGRMVDAAMRRPAEETLALAALL
jgi:citrate lyase subunit beta/citryl-CoA lyase